MIITISIVIYSLFYKLTPSLEKKEETERKLDSLTSTIKKIELEQQNRRNPWLFNVIKSNRRDSRGFTVCGRR